MQCAERLGNDPGPTSETGLEHGPLAPLLHAYALVDADVAKRIGIRMQHGHALACREGCSQCCSQPVPLTLYEALGMGWYVAHRLEEEERKHILRTVTAARHPGLTCPFLIEDRCAVHPVRPIACRRYNVFGSVCQPDEDPVEDRPGDVLVPGAQAQEEAFRAILTLAGFKDQAAKDKAIAGKLLLRQAVLIQEVNWLRMILGAQG